MHKTIFMLVVAILNIIAANEILPAEEYNINLLKAMSSSGDGSRSMLCFNYYIPMMDQIAKKFQNDFSDCLQKSQNDRSEANAATLSKRLELGNSANSSCELLRLCSNIPSPEDFFECFAHAGSDNTLTMYEINANSTNYLSDLQEALRLLEYNENKCTNETRRIYERDSTAAYADFNKCNMGLKDIPTTTEATSTTQYTKTTETEASVSEESSTETAIETTTKSKLLQSRGVSFFPRRHKKSDFNQH